MVERHRLFLPKSELALYERHINALELVDSFFCMWRFQITYRVYIGVKMMMTRRT